MYPFAIRKPPDTKSLMTRKLAQTICWKGVGADLAYLVYSLYYGKLCFVWIGTIGNLARNEQGGYYD